MRTGALAVGACLVSPWGVAAYALAPGRVFTVAGWVRVGVADALSTAPVLRWVVEAQRWDAVSATSTGEAVTLHRWTSEPFVVRAGQWTRVARPVAVPSDWWQEAVAAPQAYDYVINAAGRWRVRLEVVTAPSRDAATSTMAVRGAHLYAGADRGDAAGLLATPVVGLQAFGVGIPAARAFPVNRIDVHGVDRLSHVTAAYATVQYGPTIADQRGGVGASAGRLTIRLRSPLPDAATVTAVRVRVEEVAGGPGGPFALQRVVGWREVDATDDVVSVQVERATDADPTDSTVPVGNFAAATASLRLDDAGGDYSLFGRSYLDLGHRIELAQGFAYTNRHPDPMGVRAAAGDLASGGYVTPPTPYDAVAPVLQPVTADGRGQMPPAVTQATGSDLCVAAPMPEGATVRASVWVRWTGATVADQPRVTLGGGLGVVDAGGVTQFALVSSVEMVPAAEPGRDAPDTWWLVKVPAVTLPAGCDRVALIVHRTGTAAGVTIAAPVFERVVDDPSAPGRWAPVEVVETAPAGVFYSTSWGDSATDRTVDVQAVDVLGLRSGRPLSELVRVGTTVAADLRHVARRYLDLGDDQLIIDATNVYLPYATPADDVGTQVADLAKVAALTVHTDGLGRLRGVTGAGSLDPEPDAAYASSTSLVAASTTLTPDVVRNDVRVVTHPVQVGPVETVASVGFEDPPVFPFPWDAGDPRWIVIPPNVPVTIELEYGPTVDPAFRYGWVSSTSGGVTIPTGTPVTGWTTDSAVLIEDLEVTATRARVTFRAAMPPAPDNPTVYVLRAWVEGRPVEEMDVALRYTRPASIAAFGRRPVDVSVRLAQSQAAAPSVAAGVLDAYSLRDEDGRRWLPDLDVETLFDPWREVTDAMLVQAPDRSLGGLYRVVTHRQAVDVGGTSGIYARRALTTTARFTLDVSELDGDDRLTY